MDWNYFREAYIYFRDMLTGFFVWLAAMFESKDKDK